MPTPEFLAAIKRTDQFFAENPTKWITGNMAETADRNMTIPFADDADCFCYGGRLARELGQAPAEVRPDEHEYAPGYFELDVVKEDLSRRIYRANDRSHNAKQAIERVHETLALPL